MRTNSFIFVLVIFSLPIAIYPTLNPQQVSSVNGVLDVILVADNTKVNLNGQLVSLLLWNGSYIPPTLRMNPGDNFTLTIFNRLKMSTNVHFHGLTISPLAPADNSLLEISGMTSYRYSFQLSTQHSSGLFFYHAHTKDTSETQVFQGLSGLIIVEGLLNNYPSSVLTGISEVIMALKDLQFENSTSTNATVPLIQNLGMPSICTVNGLVNPVINITPNEVQLWRIANAGANRFYKLSFSPNITLWEIAQDGSHLNQLIPWTQNSSRLLGPGNRIELLVVGPPEGIYTLQTLRIVSGKHGPVYPQVTLATLNSTGTPMPYKLLPNTSVSPLQNLQLSNVKQRRTLEFAMMEDSMMMMSGMTMPMPNTSSTGADPLVKATWTINDNTFDPNRVDIRVNLGDIEEWTIRNKDQELHNFHIHQVHFQVVSIDKVPQPFNGYMDTITIPAADPDNGKPYGEVKLLIPFTDPKIIGKFAFHCHILKHEDNGMMSLIEVASSSGGKLNTQETGILLLLSTLIVCFLAMIA